MAKSTFSGAGAKLVARALRDAGFEVIDLGIRQRPEAIASDAVQEDVRIVGLSLLSGAHVALTRKTAPPRARRHSPVWRHRPRADGHALFLR